MRIIDQAVMNQLFEITDAIFLNRESIQVPLAMEGEGKVERTSKGDFEITLPDTDDLGPFLATLVARLKVQGFEPPDPEDQTA